MTSVFRGSRNDIETGFAEFIPERSAVRLHPARQVNSNSLAFLVTVLLLFMILHSNQCPLILWYLLIARSSQLVVYSVIFLDESKDYLQLWLVLGVFFMATTIRMYATCQQLQAQAQIHAAASNGLLGHTELRLHMPSLLANRGRLQGLHLQLALLDREFDDLGHERGYNVHIHQSFPYPHTSLHVLSRMFIFLLPLFADNETLRALDADNDPTAPSMTEVEINALPIHKDKVTGPQSSSVPQASSSVLHEKKQDNGTGNGSIKSSDDALAYTVCLEQVLFHANCIEPWLRQQGTCPVCKYRAGWEWHENGHELDCLYPD